MRQRALDGADPLRPAGLLLGTDHPLARTIDGCQSTQRQCVIVAAMMVGSIHPAVDGHTWAVALIAAAAVTLAALLLVLAARYQAIRDRAVELIADGQDAVAVKAVQAQRQRLLRPRTQIGLARRLDDIVRQASSPRSRELRPPAPLFDHRVVRTVTGDMQAIARLLRRGRSGAPGLARLETLVTHAGSALYGNQAERLQIELQQVRRLLGNDRDQGRPHTTDHYLQHYRTTTHPQ